MVRTRLVLVLLVSSIGGCGCGGGGGTDRQRWLDSCQNGIAAFASYSISRFARHVSTDLRTC